MKSILLIIPGNEKRKSGSGDGGIENNESNRNSSDCVFDFDPLLSVMLKKPTEVVECVWHDPVIVNETYGWILIHDDSEPKSYPILVDETLKTSIEDSDSSCHRKIQRGRPRKGSKNQCGYPMSSPSSSKSCTEAQNTWKTAKLLGISAIDEKAVLSGIRKSKRLLIMDGKLE